MNAAPPKMLQNLDPARANVFVLLLLSLKKLLIKLNDTRNIFAEHSVPGKSIERGFGLRSCRCIKYVLTDAYCAFLCSLLHGMSRFQQPLKPTHHYKAENGY